MDEDPNSLPSTFQDNGDLLKKCLLQFPRRYNYQFTEATSVDLRRVLFFAASYKGQFLKQFFHNVDESLLPSAWQHVLIPERYQHLEGETVYFQENRLADPCHPNRSCGRKLMKGETVYRCITCRKDQSSGLCSSCFDKEAHEGHEVVETTSARASGGVCDCGDPDAWKQQFDCKYHDIEETPLERISYMLKEAMFQTFEIALDYVVDIISGSFSTLSKDFDMDMSSVFANISRSTLDGEAYFGTDWTGDRYELLLYEDSGKQYREAVDRICKAISCDEEFAGTIVDEINSYGRARVMVSHQLDELLTAQKTISATGLPSVIKSSRDVFREDMCLEIIQWLSEISTGEVMGNYNIVRNLITKAFCRKWRPGIRKILDTNRTVTPGVLIDNQIPLLSKKSIRPINDTTHWNTPAEPWKIGPSLATECQYDPFMLSPDSDEKLQGSRFQTMIFLDSRLWNALRTQVHNLFNSVLAPNRMYGAVICCQYVDIYPTMFEIFFTMDRFPENSAMTNITSQIFNSSSNATLITEHGDLTRLLAYLHGLLTRNTVCHPTDVDVSLDLAPSGFKNRKIGQVFYDLSCLLSKTESLETVLCPDFFNQLCDLLALFQGRPVNKREAVAHIEYESNDFGVYFNTYSLTSNVSEMASKCFMRAGGTINPQGLVELVMRRILSLVFTGNPTLIKVLSERTDMMKPDMMEVETVKGPMITSSFEVHRNPVSLLHPLHALLAWVIQYSGIQSIDIILGNDTDKISKFILGVLDFPLRTFVLLSQIKIGFWVRNGLSIRTQMQVYRNSILRENGVMKDLSLIQVMLSVCPPSESFLSIVARWSLLPWMKEDFGNHQDYDETALHSMVEEFMTFMIYTLTDVSFLTPPDQIVEQRVINHVIHTLFLEPMTYSKLVLKLPDYISNDKSFDIFLDRVTDRIPSKDVGHPCSFKVKDEYLDQVTPYYINYTPNQRDDAEKLIKERLAKQNKTKVADSVIPSQTPVLEGTVLQSLYQVTTSKLFVQILKSTLKFVDHDKSGKFEPMLDLVLHLIHIAVEGKEKSFSLQFCTNMFSELRVEEHNEPFYYESVAALLYKFLTNDAFSASHAKIRAIFKSVMGQVTSTTDYLKEQVLNYDPSILTALSNCQKSLKLTDFERKKKLALERRSKLMEKFKKQQNKFVLKNECKNCDDDVEMADVNEQEDHEEDGTNNYWKYPDHHCYLCQMPKDGDELVGVVTNIHKTSIARKIPFTDKYWTVRSFKDCKPMDSEDSVDHNTSLDEYFQAISDDEVIGPAFNAHARSQIINEVTASSCGHGMHLSCYKNYLEENKSRQYQITRTVPEDFEHGEFTCPLCKSIGNVFFPILWTDNRYSFNDFVTRGYATDISWFEGMESFLHEPIEKDECVNAFKQSLSIDVTKHLKPSYREKFFSPDSQFFRDLKERWGAVEEKIVAKSVPVDSSQLSRLILCLVRGIEIIQRGVPGSGGLIFNQVSHQDLSVLRSFLSYQKASCIQKMVFTQEESISREHTGEGFKVEIGEEILARMYYFISDHMFNGLADIDVLEFMISLFPCFEVTNYSINRMGYIYFTIQSLATLLSQLKEGLFVNEFSLFGLDTYKVDDGTLSNLHAILKSLRDIHPIFDFVGDELFGSKEFLKVFYTLFVKCMTTFLRKVAILTLGKCGDLRGSCLDGEFDDEYTGLECDRLCVVLNLPSIAQMLESLHDPGTIEGLKFKGFLNFLQQSDYELSFDRIDYPGEIRLIDLPQKLSDILTKLMYNDENYMDMLNKGADPAVCLVCGSILNLQDENPIVVDGVKIGDCNYHIRYECVSHVGMFLMLRSNAMLLLNKHGKGSFYVIPYADNHGSLIYEGKGMKVLYYDEAKYQNFMRKMWLGDDIVNYITRKLEGALDIGGWETF